MYARVAAFEADPADLQRAIEQSAGEVAGEAPSGPEGARMLMLVDRAGGQGLGITLPASEDAMRGNEPLDAMTPGAGARRAAVAFYEVPVQAIDDV